MQEVTVPKKLPERLSALNFALHDAQSVVAREYGFSSFAELRRHVEAARPAGETLRALLEPSSAPLPERSRADAARGGRRAARSRGRGVAWCRCYRCATRCSRCP